MQAKNNEQIMKIGNWVKERYKPYEGGIAVLIIFVLMIDSYTDINTGVLKVVLLLSLAVMYYLLGFSVKETDTSVERLITKMAYMSSSVAVVGILFRLQQYPGSSVMLTVGGFSLALVFTTIYTMNKMKKQFVVMPQRMMIQIAIIAAIALSLKFSTDQEIIDYGVKMETTGQE